VAIEPPPLGAIVETDHLCFDCTQKVAGLRGWVIDHLPGGADSSYLVKLHEAWVCPNCGANEPLVSTDVYRAKVIDAVTLLGEVVE